MSADKTVIDNMEVLAMLKFSENERETLGADANAVFDNLKLLAECDLSGIEPLIHVLRRENVFRKDIVKKFPREEVLANAPEENDGFFQVPQTFD